MRIEVDKINFLGNGSPGEPEHQGDFITILSNDCGEVKNSIPSEVTSVLESKLQVNLFSQHAALYKINKGKYSERLHYIFLY